MIRWASISAELNAIYNQVISVAKISAKFFKDNKAIKDQFSYAKGLSNLNQLKADKPVPPTNPPAA